MRTSVGLGRRTSRRIGGRFRSRREEDLMLLFLSRFVWSIETGDVSRRNTRSSESECGSVVRRLSAKERSDSLSKLALCLHRRNRFRRRRIRDRCGRSGRSRALGESGRSGSLDQVHRWVWVNRERGRGGNDGLRRGRGNWRSLRSGWFADLVNIEILLAKLRDEIKLKGGGWTVRR